MKAKILLMEDESIIREVIYEYLISEGYETTGVYDGEMAIEELNKNIYDLAILDIMVPKVDGIGVLKHIKDKKIDTAVIMLTALSDEKSQIMAFDNYAEDYVVKPVSPRLLLKRIETILRRIKFTPVEKTGEEKTMTEKEKNNLLQVYSGEYQVYYDGELIPLTLSEFLLIEKLMENPNRVYNREVLINAVYGYDYIGSDRAIDSHIKNLRKKLPRPYIKTVIGVGYKFDERAGE